MRSWLIATALLFVTPAMGIEYCGMDVPYDVVIRGDTLVILSDIGVQVCTYGDDLAECDDGRIMSVTPKGRQIVLDWPGLTEPVLMPRCEDMM